MSKCENMTTPIYDFTKQYGESHTVRFHMPGHKGEEVSGHGRYDITEIKGADALYEADGIILESEENASRLFGTGKTIYSTEGSSQCIKAMIYIACHLSGEKRTTILAARNVHKAFIYGVALCDCDVEWIEGESSDSICSSPITAKEVEQKIEEMSVKPTALYITSPDYLGNVQDVEGIAEVCHKNNMILMVDNAHGAYLRFLPESRHPMDLGADICCDSAHKTLPVLTGGAYLHISKAFNDKCAIDLKKAMVLFGSTSPSYLLLSSLDMCNKYLVQDYKEKLNQTIKVITKAKEKIRQIGFSVVHSDPLKIVLKTGNAYLLADSLREDGIECEYADNEYLVLMITPMNKAEDIEKLVDSLGSKYADTKTEALECANRIHDVRLSIRQAMFADSEVIDVNDSVGRICAAPTVACPPAVPVVISGEVITEDDVRVLLHYGYTTVEVCRQI